MPSEEWNLAIGELARRAGLSVRAVRLYERYGLVASMRAGNGRRYFREQELSRLEQVSALKAIGLTLKQIGSLLTDGALDPASVIAGQLAALESRKADLEWAIACLRVAEGQLQTAELKSDALCRLIAAGQEAKQEPRDPRVANYYSEEQIVRLKARQPGAGRKRITAAEWMELIVTIERLAADRPDALGVEAQAAAKRWSALLQEFTRGEADIVESLRRQAEDAYAGVSDDDAAKPATPSSLSKRGWQFISRAIEQQSA